MLIRRHPTDIVQLVPKRAKDAYKGTCGRALIIAGSNQYTGAASLMVEAALRSGVGMVYVVAIHQVADVIRKQSPEAIVIEVPEQDGCMSVKAMSQIEPLFEANNLTAMGVGPGLGKMKGIDSFLIDLLTIAAKKNVATIVDADAINPAYQHIETLYSLQSDQFILTPHPKEFSDMIGQSFEGGSERSEIIKIAKKIKQVIVYKSSKTMVINEKELWQTPTGNESLATAGSGDVLAGIITGLVAQGLGSFESAKLGVYLHGLSAEFASQALGIHSVLARDICKYLSDSFKEVVYGNR